MKNEPKTMFSLAILSEWKVSLITDLPLVQYGDRKHMKLQPYDQLPPASKEIKVWK